MNLPEHDSGDYLEFANPSTEQIDAETIATHTLY